MATRPLTPQQEQRLRGLRQLSRLLDSLFRVPGTSFRVGLDPIVGLIPGLGDVVTSLMTMGIILQGWQLGIPKVVQARMVINVAIDALVGVIPLIGDLFDFAWKANDRNLALLERHAQDRRCASAGDWVFVLLMLAAAAAVAALPIVLLAWLASLFGVTIL